MNKRWLSVRNALVAAAFLASTEACSAWQCAAECPKFGGQFGQGNVCYCCG